MSLVPALLPTTDGDEGAEMVAQWHRRNVLIFANVLRLIESDKERVLVIYGSGHRAHLREFVEQHPDGCIPVGLLA